MVESVGNGNRSTLGIKNALGVSLWLREGEMAGEKPHAVCIPYPTQGHITPMLTVAKLLLHRDFHITFVNTEYNHRRLLRSTGPSALDGTPDFRFLTIPDGLPPSTTDDDVTQDVASLSQSIMTGFLGPFRELLAKLNSGSAQPPVTCIFADATMIFAIDAAEELGVPVALLWTASACGLLGYQLYDDLLARGLLPLRDEENLCNGYLDTPVDWVPGTQVTMRLRDLPTFLRTNDPDDIMLKFVFHGNGKVHKAAAVVLNTFHQLEAPVVGAMVASLPLPLYTVGPLSLLSRHINNSSVASMGSNLWREDRSCIQWLEGREASSVVYVNFGSITVMTNGQLVEFAQGLAASNLDFLWVIRHDLVRGDKAVLPSEFLEETKGRGLLVSWCPQEAVLAHAAVGCFLTHCGWNSILESICSGVPMLCWPFFAEQTTNCRYACGEWGVGVEIGGEVGGEQLAAMIREVMVGEKGKEMKRRTLEWMDRALQTTGISGDSFASLDKLVEEVLLSQPKALT